MVAPYLLIPDNLSLSSSTNYPIKGIDISNSYKGELNWSKLNPHNDFVVLRAVRCWDKNKTKGLHTYVSIVDSNFKKNWLALERSKITRGAYHFFAPDVPAEEQFKVFKANVKLNKGDLPPILDVEMKECNMDEAIKWLELAKDYYGVDPILYTEYFFYKWFLKNKNKRYPLWIYLNENFMFMPYFDNPKCLFWQYKHDQKLPHFNDLVDLNVFLGNENEFKQLLLK